jgi:uncharacterized protein
MSSHPSKAAPMTVFRKGAAMRRVLAAVLIAFFAAIGGRVARAAETPPTQESIQELMSLTDLRKTIEGVAQNMEASTEASVRQAFVGQGLSQKQERLLREMSAKMVAIFKEEMSPEILEPMYIEIYRNALTQQEVDGMIAFYKTEAGKAVMGKMPSITRQALEVTLRRMQTFMPRLQQIQQEMLQRMKQEQ